MNQFGDETPISTPRPFACSTIDRNVKNTLENGLNSFCSDESLGIISVKSDLDELIDNVELKKPASTYVQTQRELASRALEKRRESSVGRVSTLPSKYFRPSDFSNCSSAFQISKGSTVTESDLSGSGNTSTPRCSLASNQRVDIAESLMKMSLEIQNPEMSLSEALARMDEEYKHLQGELNESSFQPAENLKSRLLQDELEWKNKFDIPVSNREFSTVNMDTSKLSMSTFFKQRSEDISNVIPTFNNPAKLSIGNTSSIRNLSVNTVNSTAKNESLSLEMIAKFLKESDSESPGKLIDKLMKQGPKPENFKDDKENVPIGSSNKNIAKSLTSLRSSSSLSNLPDGKLPIVTTHNELAWGCVKPGRSEARKFSIRNKSSSKLRIICTIPGPLFRFEDASNILKLTLHANETKSITVLFNPLKDGAVADEMIFTPASNILNQTRKQSIKLYGYGGIGIVDFRNVSKDGAENYWLTLTPSNSFETINVCNKGTLTIFAIFSYVPKKISFSNVEVHPNALIIPPNECGVVEVSFKMCRDDARFFQGNGAVFEVGTLKIVSGTEATRGRIRRLSKLALEKNLDVDLLTNELQVELEGESIPSDVVKCCEGLNNLRVLLQEFKQTEVGILVENELDSTLVQCEETTLFHSLCENSTLKLDDAGVSFENYFKLEPERLLLVQPNKMKDCLFLTSNDDVEVEFQVNVPRNVRVKPTRGFLQPRGTVLIELFVLEYLDSNVMNFNVHIEILNRCVLLNSHVKVMAFSA